MTGVNSEAVAPGPGRPRGPAEAGSAVSAAAPPRKEFTFSRKEFRFLAETVHGLTGIVLGEQKYEMVYARLARRLRQLGLTRFQHYVELLQGPGRDEEIGFLIDAITTNLTRFFREDYQLKQMLRLIDQSVPAGEARGLKIWSAGCSTGQEPYSIAMALKAGLKNRPRLDARILATDIDRTILQKARRGLYSSEEVEHVPSHFLPRYFQEADDGLYEVSPQIRSMIVFNRLNLMEDWPFRGQFDFIFCRNVVIYFDEPTKERLARRFHAALGPDGVLFLGHSEALMGAIDGFAPAGRAAFRKIAA